MKKNIFALTCLLFCSALFSCKKAKPTPVLLQPTYNEVVLDPEVNQVLQRYIAKYKHIAPEQSVYTLYVDVVDWDSTIFTFEKMYIYDGFYLLYPPSFYCSIDTTKVYIFSAIDALIKGDFKNTANFPSPSQTDTIPECSVWTLVRHKQHYTLFEKGWYPYLPPFNKPTVVFTPPP